jgi:uncharacterized protein YjbJ (UPF0337 family)
MGAQSDEAKGRVKEAAGALTGDDQLKREGKLDQAGGAAKGKVMEAAERLNEAIDMAKEKVARTADKSTKDNN